MAETELFQFLDSYYWKIWNPNNLCDEGEDAPYPDELLQPLDKRDPAFMQEIDRLVANTNNINRGEYYPLSLTVGNADRFLTAYLLDHGADPFIEDSSESDQNHFMDILDHAIFSESITNDRDEIYLNALMETAAVLAKHGVTEGGYHCIEINKEDRTLYAHSPRFKF